jgi:hypothetical protein
VAGSCFVRPSVGGMTYTQVRSVYILEQNVDVNKKSTVSTILYRDFMK